MAQFSRTVTVLVGPTVRPVPFGGCTGQDGTVAITLVIGAAENLPSHIKTVLTNEVGRLSGRFNRFVRLRQWVAESAPRQRVRERYFKSLHMIAKGMTKVTVNLESQFANDPDASVEDGETFLTVAKDKSTNTYQLYQPDRENYEFVGLAEEYVDSLESNRVEENHQFKVWGEKEAWDNTPSPVFNI